MRTQVEMGEVRGQLEEERREPGAKCEVEVTGCDKAKNTAAVLASLSAGSPWWHREACPQRLRPISPLNVCGPSCPVLRLQLTRLVLRSCGGWDFAQGHRSVLWVR